MRRWILLALLASVALPAAAAKRVNVAQLEQIVTSTSAAHKADAEVARQIQALELSERLTDATFDRLAAQLTSEPQTALALRLLADQSAFLDPPPSELLADSAPDDATQQRMLETAKSYATQTLPRLPNFLATRTINRYDDSPQAQKKGGWEFRSGLHLVDTSSRETSVRDARDNESPTTGSALWQAQVGLISGGEFGSTLGMVVSDTTKGTITWGYWETTAAGRVAVFRYSVPKAASHYEVIGSVQRQAAMDTPDSLMGKNKAGAAAGSNLTAGSRGSLAVLTNPGYHGSLWLDPQNGTVLRITVEADSKNVPFRRADILVRYGSVQIADKKFICPVRSLALSVALVDPNMNPDAPTVWLNETLFTNYRRFASTTRILNDAAASETQTPPAGTSESNRKGATPDAAGGTITNRSPAAEPSAPLAAQSPVAPATPQPEDHLPLGETSEPAKKEPTPNAPDATVPASTPAASSDASSAVQPAAQQSADAQQTPTKIVVHVNRVLVPVVVRDKQGRPIPNLTKEDFQVFDNDKPRTISAFSVEKRAAPGTNAPGSTERNALPLAANTAPQASTLPNRITVFLFDDMHLALEDIAYVKKAGAKALSAALADSGVADVVSTSGKINSGLTRDLEKLNDAINHLSPQTHLRNNKADCPDIDYYRADLIENKHDPDAIQDGILQLYICFPGVPHDTAERMVEMAARRTLESGQVDVNSTFTVIGELVRRMASLPGQRTLILVSPGFIVITPEALTAQSNVIDLAAQSNVIIDTLDARGLYSTEDTASDNVGARNATEPMRTTEYRRRAMLTAESPLAELADGTAGAFFHHNNDIDAGLSALATGPEYVYLLELSLDDVKPDGHYHPLKVKVDRDGVQIQARHGYYAPPPLKNTK